MFRRCTRLLTLDVSNWDVSSVTNLSETFSTCSKIDNLNVSK